MPGEIDAAFYLPSRGLWIMACGAWKRYRCGRRFGHFRTEGEWGYGSCSRCNAPLI